jgi:hypothetical protein
MIRDVTGPWHHGLSRAGCFSDGRGTGRRHCSDRLEGRWRRLRPSREPRGTTAAGARRPQHKGERVAGARNAPATSTTPASPGTWTAPPAGSSTQHQPRRPVVRAEADSAGGGPVGEGTRRGGPPVPAHDAGEWLHGKRQRVHTAVQNETGHQLRRRRSAAPGPPAPAHGDHTTTATAGPHCELDGAPLARPLSNPVVRMGSPENAEVLYAGSAPAQVSGVMQINVRIPSSAPSGNVNITVHLPPPGLDYGGSGSSVTTSIAIR